MGSLMWMDSYLVLHIIQGYIKLTCWLIWSLRSYIILVFDSIYPGRWIGYCKLIHGGVVYILYISASPLVTDKGEYISAITMCHLLSINSPVSGWCRECSISDLAMEGWSSGTQLRLMREIQQQNYAYCLTIFLDLFGIANWARFSIR